MIEHLDTARSAALMPDESCGGPCLRCALDAAHATAGEAIRYVSRWRRIPRPTRHTAGDGWRYEYEPTNDPAYAALLDADNAAWRVYHSMRRAYAGATAMMKGTGNG